jgi:iron complex transport system substrate-binding protein
MPPARPVPTESIALADLWTDLRRVSDALGVPERGVQLITRLRTRIEAVALRAAQQPRRPRVACLVGLDPPVAAAGWISELIALAGGEDVLGAPGAWPRVLVAGDLERADPDVIVLAPAGMDLPAALAAAHSLASRPGWPASRAAREGQAHVADGAALFGRPGPQLAETLETLAEMLHPAAFRFGHEGKTWTRLAGGSGT